MSQGSVAAAATAVSAAATLGFGRRLFGATAAGRSAFFRRAATAFGGFAGGAATAFGGGFAGIATAAATATARLVRVAVGKFGQLSRADRSDFDIEVQRLSGEGMIAVEDDFAAFDLLDRQDAHAEVGFGVEAHADLRRVGAKMLDRDALQ